jgi:GNAT superfamily N-acetyltransferase
MNDSPTVRPISPGDCHAVAQLTAQLGYERTAEQVRQWVQELGAHPHQAAFVAELDGEVVAWIEVSLARHLQSQTFGLIGGLVVRDGRRGLGIGRKLCGEAERWTLRHGATTIRVTSRSTREAAHRFYLRDGYRQSKISMVFEKTLTP